MIVRGNPAWNNELPDKYKGLFEDDAPEESAAAEPVPDPGIPAEHLEMIRQDSFHREMFAKMSDGELKEARKLCPFLRILRFFKREGRGAADR